jgi:hypothetical protein
MAQREPGLLHRRDTTRHEHAMIGARLHVELSPRRAELRPLRREQARPLRGTARAHAIRRRRENEAQHLETHRDPHVEGIDHDVETPESFGEITYFPAVKRPPVEIERRRPHPQITRRLEPKLALGAPAADVTELLHPCLADAYVDVFEVYRPQVVGRVGERRLGNGGLEQRPVPGTPEFA